MSSDRVKYRDRVREVALDQYGFVTTRDASTVGVPPAELAKLASRGGIDNVAYGLYRVPDLPPHPLDQFAEALLRAGHGAYLYGESVLALFGLADVNPRQIRVAVPRRVRARLPEFMEVERVPPGAPTTTYEGLSSQPVADALLECRGRVDPQRLRRACRDARKQGLLTSSELRRVTKELGR